MIRSLIRSVAPESMVSFLKLLKEQGAKIIIIRIINGILKAPFYAGKIIRKIASMVLPKALKERLKNYRRFFFKPSTQTRRYLRSDQSVESFFKTLNQREISYVILRWFEDLPHVAKGEDIDLLVADKDIEKITDLFSQDPRNQSFDLYSESGLSGADYKSMPYYPPGLAKEILQTRCKWNNDYFVPDPKRYFLSLAYHVIFHKGQKSGLKKKGKPDSNKTKDHDYLKHLQKAAADAGIDVELEYFEDVYSVLYKSDWLPNLDMMRFFARNDEWIKDMLPEPTDSDPEGMLTAFVVREWAVKNNKMPYILKLLRRGLFDIIEIIELEEEQKKRAKVNIRGGNWGRGPYWISGGDPAVMIIAYDYHPRTPKPKEAALYPYVKNRNVFIKHHIRDYLNAGLLYFKQTNCLHSSDDEEEAWSYINHVIPEKSEEISNAVQKRADLYKSKYPVLHLYDSYRTRAKIEKIDYHGKPAVLKTFKLGCERFAEREAFVCEKFSKDLETIPPLLEKTENTIIIPWYEDLLNDKSASKRIQMLKPYASEILKTMRFFYDQGYAFIGFYPGNILLTPDSQLKIIDFEFIYKYKTKPDSFAESYDIKGIPSDFDGDLPRGSTHNYRNTWQAILKDVKDW